MGMEGWRKLEARDDKALGRDDQDLGHAVSRATALDGQGRTGKVAVCRLPYAEKGEKGRYASDHQTSTPSEISARAYLDDMRISA